MTLVVIDIINDMALVITIVVSITVWGLGIEHAECPAVAGCSMNSTTFLYLSSFAGTVQTGS